jgi:hypothetical protein
MRTKFPYYNDVQTLSTHGVLLQSKPSYSERSSEGTEQGLLDYRDLSALWSCVPNKNSGITTTSS